MAAVLASVALAGCSLVTQSPPAFEPAGTYDFTTDYQGTSIAGTMVLRQTSQGLAGSFTTQLSGELAFDGIRVEGRTMQLRSVLPDAELTMALEFAEDYRFTGRWSLSNGLGGTLAGSRRAQDDETRPAGRP